jgi:hypothetical protein
MCKELLVILVYKVVDPKRIIGKKWRAKEEERHKRLLTKKKATTAGFDLTTHRSSLLGGRQRKCH